jgi:hypothetical protein
MARQRPASQESGLTGLTKFRSAAQKGSLARLVAYRSSGSRRLELALQRRDLISQAQSALFESPQAQIIVSALEDVSVDQVVKIGVFHAQFDQSTVR